MAYGKILYTGFYSVRAQILWEVEIYEKDYGGSSTRYTSTHMPVSIRKIGKGDLFERVQGTEATINIQVLDGQDFDYLFTTHAREYYVKILKNSVSHWQGYILPGQIISSYRETKDISIIATDDLRLLNAFAYFNDSTFVPYDEWKSPLLSIIRCVSKTGLLLPIRSTINLEPAELSPLAYDEDALTSVKINEQRFQDVNLNAVGSLTALDELLRPFGAKIYQSAGYWYIERTAHKFEDDNDYREYTSNGAYVESGTITIAKEFTVANPDPISTLFKPVRPAQLESMDGYKSVQVIQDFGLRRSIFPGFNFPLNEFIPAYARHWTNTSGSAWVNVSVNDMSVIFCGSNNPGEYVESDGVAVIEDTSGISSRVTLRCGHNLLAGTYPYAIALFIETGGDPYYWDNDTEAWVTDPAINNFYLRWPKTTMDKLGEVVFDVAPFPVDGTLKIRFPDGPNEPFIGSVEMSPIINDEELVLSVMSNNSVINTENTEVLESIRFLFNDRIGFDNDAAFCSGIMRLNADEDIGTSTWKLRDVGSTTERLREWKAQTYIDNDELESYRGKIVGVFDFHEVLKIANLNNRKFVPDDVVIELKAENVDGLFIEVKEESSEVNLTEEYGIPATLESIQTQGIVTPNQVVGGGSVNLSPYLPRVEWAENGFENLTDATLTFTDGTRVFSIQPVGDSYTYWFEGVQYTSSGDTITIADTEGLHVIYYDGVTITASVNPTNAQLEVLIRTMALITIIYWDATNNEGVYVGEERHGKVMDPITHAYLHFIEGLRYISPGLGLSNILADQSGALDSHAQFGVDSGNVADEDLFHAIATIISTTGLLIIYLDGASGNMRSKTSAGFSVLTDVDMGTGATGRLVYNLFSGGVWTTPTISNNDYVLYHVFATTEKDTPMFSFMGQNSYATISAARDGATTEIYELNLNDILFPEYRAIATVIFQVRDAYGNAVKARIVTTDLGDDYIDWRNQVISRAEISTSAHGALTELPLDQHSGYLWGLGRAGGQILIGGTAVTDKMIFQSTSGVAESGAEFQWLGGNDGDETHMTLDWQGTLTVANNAVVSGNFGVGIAPSYKAHIYSGASGQTAHANARTLVVEDDIDHGFSVLGTNTSVGRMIFASPQNTLEGGLAYNHATRSLAISTAAGAKITIDSSGNTVFVGTITGVTSLTVDNLNLNGNTIAATGNLILTAVDSALPITIGTGAGDDFTINGTGFTYSGDLGFVGVGIATPTAKFQVDIANGSDTPGTNESVIISRDNMAQAFGLRIAATGQDLALDRFSASAWSQVLIVARSSGTITVAGTLNATSLGGTLTTASQTNITALGTLVGGLNIANGQTYRINGSTILPNGAMGVSATLGATSGAIITYGNENWGSTSALFYGFLPFYRGISQQMANHLQIPVRKSNYQYNTGEAGQDYFHAIAIHGDYGYLVERTDPTSIVRFELEDIDERVVFTFPDTDVIYDSGQQIWYCEELDEMMVVFGEGGEINIASINLANTSMTLRVTIVDAVSELSPSGWVILDGFIYIATESVNEANKVYKVDISDWSSSNYTMSADTSQQSHSMVTDGEHIYVTTVDNDGTSHTLYQITTALVTVDTATLNGPPHDDIIDCGDRIYVSYEDSAGLVDYIDKGTMAVTSIDTGESTSSFALFFDGNFIYCLFATSPGTMIRLDPYDHSIKKHTFPSTYNDPNEIVSDGGRLFITFWGTSAKMMRMSIPKFDDTIVYPDGHISSWGVDKLVEITDDAVNVKTGAEFQFNGDNLVPDTIPATKVSGLGASQVGLDDYYQVHNKVVTLSVAQIEALKDTPIDLIDAPGNDLMIVPIHIIGILDWNSAAWDTDTVLIVYTEDATGWIAENDYLLLTTGGDGDVAQQFYMASGHDSGNRTDGQMYRENKAIRIKANTLNPDNGDSPLKIHIFYKIVRLT